MTALERSKRLLLQIAKRFPGTKWIWIMSVDGLPVSGIGDNFYNIKEIVTIFDNRDSDEIEDIPDDIGNIAGYSPVESLSMFFISCTEKTLERFNMGEQRFSVIAGANLSFFIIPISPEKEFFCQWH